jgi:hypothetical protein
VELEIKYKKIYEDQDCAFVGGQCRVVSPKPTWVPIDVSTIGLLTRDEALVLLDRQIDIVIKQDGVLISNNKDMRNQFRKRGDRVVALENIAPNAGLVRSVGFL